MGKVMVILVLMVLGYVTGELKMNVRNKHILKEQLLH